MTVEEYAWPISRLGEGLTELGSVRGLIPVRAAIANPPSQCSQDPGSLALWLEQAAAALALEVEPVETPYPQIPALLRHAGPALLRLTPDGPGNGLDERFLLLLGSRGSRVNLLGMDGRAHWLPLQDVRRRLCASWESPRLEEINGLMDQAQVEERRRRAVGQALLNEQLAQHHLTDCWMVRPSPGMGLWDQVRRSRMLRPLGLLFSGELISQVLLVLSWAVIGRGALQGHFETAQVWAWALLLLTMIPVHTLVKWAQQRLTLTGTTLLRQRILHGALQIDPEEVRHGGVGYFLDRALAVEALESLVLSGGFNTVLAWIQLLSAGVVLYLGVGGIVHAGLLGLVFVYVLLAGWFYYRRYSRWDDAQRKLTSDLVERMVGHRTRLAQESPTNRHDEEDALLTRYLATSERRDSSQLLMTSALPQIWLLLGLAVLGYWIINEPASPTELAVSVGGVLLGLRGLTELIQGASSLIHAAVAWREIAPIERKAAQVPAPAQDPGLMLAAGASPDGEQLPLLTGHQLSFRYRPEAMPVLSACDISIGQGERLLLEGTSGGGKSTLASLLAGIRRPEGGLLLLHGYDQPSLGEENWRRQVVLAPQFHENFVFTGSLAFNLLLGRRWPPLAEDMQEAEAVCREMGLGPLLERMPGGLMQEVGESGWQLSHGERSRLFMARALLQGAELLVLDESFAALDPENVEQALQCVWRRAPALVVIAHP